MHASRCTEEFHMKDPANPSQCIPIEDCSIPICNNGHCVTTEDGDRLCHCFPGWSGILCDEPGPEALAATATMSTGATISIVVAIIAVLCECISGFGLNKKVGGSGHLLFICGKVQEICLLFTVQHMVITNFNRCKFVNDQCLSF